MRKGIDPLRVKTMLAKTGPHSMKIGRFRTAEKTPKGVCFKMYERPIFVLEGNELTLDLCGYWTQAVVKGMKDYADAIGLDISPSLAKGKFTCSYKGTVHGAWNDNKIRIQL